jgi:hypothetical protein
MMKISSPNTFFRLYNVKYFKSIYIYTINKYVFNMISIAYSQATLL